MLKDPIEDRLNYFERELKRLRESRDKDSVWKEEVAHDLMAIQEFISLIRVRVRKDGFVDEEIRFQPRKLDGQ